MIYIETNSIKPHINLAYEEYFLKNKKLGSESIFMLWRNEPTVVVGKFQNTSNEINHNFIDGKKINVIRRITGGGAVYHDLGTLCYTFILRDLSSENISFSTFTLPILNALSTFGVKVEINGRNDLTIEGAKFSGTAMSLHENSLLFHGTILYDTNLSVLNDVLNVCNDKLKSKGIKSVRSRVTNIRPYIKNYLDIEAFKDALKEAVNNKNPFIVYIPDRDDLKGIQSLSEEKYKMWNWNYGKDPKASFHNKKRFDGGEIELYMDLEGSTIKACKLYGDFLGIKDIEPVEKLLEGMPYNRNTLMDILDSININEHFGNIRKEEILQCFFE